MKKYSIKIFLLSVFWWAATVKNILYAQQLTHSLNYLYNFDVEYVASNPPVNNTHTSFKPLLQSKIDTQLAIYREKKHWISKKLFTESLIKIDTGDFYFTIDPLFNLQTFQDDSSGFRGYVNGRGIRAQGNIGNKFSFYTDFFENQAFFPEYIERYAKQNQVVPGMGRYKPFKQTGVDFAIASGYISYTPAKNMNYIFGHGKLFIGEGYRSVLLSDNAFNYPYLRSTFYLWKNKIQYTWVEAKLSTLQRLSYYNSAENPFITKQMSLHYLSFKPNPYIEIGFFENTIWQTWDSSGSKPFNFQWINPIIGMDALTNSLVSANNSSIGINYKINLLKGWVMYGQYLLDDDIKHAEAYQLGTKYLLMIGKNKFRVQYEYNKSYNNAYQYDKNYIQNYWHYNQPVAYSLGGTAEEKIFRFDFQRQRYIFLLKHHVIHHKENGEYIVNSGGNINFTEILAGYLINPATNLTIEAGMTIREEKNKLNELYDKQKIIQIKLKSEIFNQYFDF